MPSSTCGLDGNPAHGRPWSTAVTCETCSSSSASGSSPPAGLIGRTARQLTDAAQMFSNVLDRLGTSDWTRSVIYSYPEPRERSLQWVAVHTVHEVHHHLLDIRRQLA
jgi:hypothetical protein